MSSLCCLCRLSVEGNHRKRKRFNGRSCDTARLVLCSVSSVALSHVNFKNPNAMLCISCDKLLNSLQAAEVKVEKIRQQIIEKLQEMQVASHGTPNKRPRIEDGNSPELPESVQELSESYTTDQQGEFSSINCIAQLTEPADVEYSHQSIEHITGLSSSTAIGQSNNTTESELTESNVVQQVTEQMLPSAHVEQSPLMSSPPLKVS